MEELDSDLLGAASAVVSVGRSLEETVLEGFVKELKGEMQRAVENLDFETAAAIRDAILELSDSSREELKRDKEDL